MRTKTLSGIVTAVFVLAGVVGPAQGGVTVIAATGEAAPDGNGTYSTFTDPVLNSQGQAAFRVQLQGTSNGALDDTAIIRADTLGATVICHEDWPTPDFNGWFQSLYSPAINDAGEVAFRADARSTLLGPFDAVGIYRGTGGVLPTQLVRGNDPSPDGNGRFLIMSDTPAVDYAGRTVFWSSFAGTAGGLSDDTAVVYAVAGGHLIYMREGQTAPDGDGQFAAFNGIARSEVGSLVCHVSLRNTSKGASNDTSIYIAGLGIREMAREGNVAPDGNGEYQSFCLDPTMDNAFGRPAFHAWLRNTIGGTDDDSGIFRGEPVGITQIARDGQSPPEGNGRYNGFDSDIAQNNTSVAFRALLRNTSGGPVDEEGMYRGDEATTTKIARGGDPAPGGNGVFRFFTDPVMNTPGHVAFYAQLAGTAGGSSDNKGIFIGDGVDTVQVARTGDPLLGSTIAELHFAAGPHYRNGLNDLAEVAYRAVLADGRDVLVLYTPFVQYQGSASGDWGDNANWTLGILPLLRYEVAIAPVGSADVAGPTSDATVKSLTVGSTGGGTATLNLTGGGNLTAVESVAIGADGRIVVGDGRTLSAAALTNQGVLSFQGGQAHVYGDVSNRPGGQILVPPAANVQMHGPVINEGVLDVGAGAEVHLNGLTGNGCSGPGTTYLAGDVRPGVDIGQMAFGGDVVFGSGCVTHIELGGPLPGADYDQILVGGDLLLDGMLEATLVSTFVPQPGQRFDIVDVAGTATGQFTALGERALVPGFGQLPVYITYAGGDGNDVALYVGVEVEADIKPGSDPNSINLHSNGVVPVAILGSETLDVGDVDLASLWFEGSEPKPKGNSGKLGSFEYVNEDLYLDLVVHFPTADVSGLDGNAVEAGLTGLLEDGTVIFGRDFVRIVGGGGGGKTASDLILLTGNYGSASGVVPEPAALAFLALGGLALVRRRRYKQHRC